MKGDKGIELKAGQNIAAYATSLMLLEVVSILQQASFYPYLRLIKYFVNKIAAILAGNFLSFIKVGSSSNKSTTYVNEMLPATLQAEKADTQSGWIPYYRALFFKTSLGCHCSKPA